MKTKSTIRIFFTRTAMLLTLLFTTLSAWAQTPRAMVVYCDENKTLYFTNRVFETIEEVLPYNEDHTSRLYIPEGSSDPLVVSFFVIDRNVTATGNNNPNWITDVNNLGYHPTTLVFESSFAHVRPTSCARWFPITTLTDIQGIENLNTSEVTNMSYMFTSCSALTRLDLSGFDTAKVTDMSYMFSRCSNLISIIIGDGWDTTSVTSSNYMFYNCTSIIGYDGTTYKPYNEWNKTMAHAGTGGYMCKYNPHAVYCASNHTLYFTTSYRQINVGGSFFPEGSDNPQTVTDVWNGTDVTDTQYPNWQVDEYRENISKVVFEPAFKNVRPKSTARWFSSFSNLEEIQGMENLNTSEVTDMQEMFFWCSKITSLDLIHFDTGKVTSMYVMFDGCGLLTTLDLDTFNTSKVTDMRSMFWMCSNLVTILIGDGWDTSKVTQSEAMFYDCTSIVGQFGTTYDRNKTDKSMAHARPGGYMCKRSAPLTLSDNSSNTETIANAIAAAEKYNVTLQGRMLYTDGDWNTLCLPFDVESFNGTPLEGFTVKEIDMETENNGHKTGYVSGTLYLNFKDATSIKAGKPYLMKKLAMKDGATTPSYTATGGTDAWNNNDSRFRYPYLIDGNTNNRWRTNFTGSPVYCEFNADAPVHMTGYKLTTGNVNTGFDPTVWTLQAKENVNDAWTIIDSRNANINSRDALPNGRTTPKSYTIQKSGNYRFFRFEVTKVGSGSNQMCLSELTMLAIYPDDAASIENPTFMNVFFDGTEPTTITSEDGAVSFTGIYNPFSIGNEGNNTILFMGADNTLYYPNAAMNINSFHAYFQLNNGIVCGNPSQGVSGINAFVLNFRDETTGIVDVNLKTASNEAGISNSFQQGWFTLDGRKLSDKPTTKGIYVNNGKKVIIK